MSVLPGAAEIDRQAGSLPESRGQHNLGAAAGSAEDYKRVELEIGNELPDFAFVDFDAYKDKGFEILGLADEQSEDGKIISLGQRDQPGLRFEKLQETLEELLGSR